MLFRAFSCATLSFCLLSVLPSSAVAECSRSNAYSLQAEITYEEIFDFEVKSYPRIMAHPYEIKIPNTAFGQLIACRIYQDGESKTAELPTTPGWASLIANGPETRIRNHQITSRDMQFVKSGPGKTHVFFSHKFPDAKFRCFVACVANKRQ
ncbi:hypothetical protein [Ruegeria sp. HKCCA5491]|uniref:hypothetical protein n=1 Tax=Ruegeria sp. HKCCA5491 TaxID=2682986 RepID=UPI001489F427|nr:hypothetical protein [Ruegeria sp. HKCCA5491]